MDTTSIILAALIPAIIAAIAAVGMIGERRIWAGKDRDERLNAGENVAPWVALVWGSWHTISTWFNAPAGRQIPLIIIAAVLGLVVGSAVVSRVKYSAGTTVSMSDLEGDLKAWPTWAFLAGVVIFGFLTGFWAAAAFIGIAGVQALMAVRARGLLRAAGADRAGTEDAIRALIGGSSTEAPAFRIDRKSGVITVTPSTASLANLAGVDQRALSIFPEHRLDVLRNSRSVVTSLMLTPLTADESRARQIAAASGGLMTGTVTGERDADVVHGAHAGDDFDWTVPVPQTESQPVAPSGTTWDF